MPSSRWPMPIATNRDAACHQAGSSCTSPGSPSYIYARSTPSGATKRSTVVVLTPRCASFGSILTRASGDGSGNSSSTSSITCPAGISVLTSSRAPVVVASADANVSNARSEGTDARTAAMRPCVGLAPSTRTVMASATQSRAASCNVLSAVARSRYAPRIGNSTSRIASSGTRTSTRSRRPSGWTND